MTHYTLFIDGRRIEAASGRRYQSVDPFLGQPWASAADADTADADVADATPRTSTRRWRRRGGRWPGRGGS